jgi:hypothetical protein
MVDKRWQNQTGLKNLDGKLFIERLPCLLQNYKTHSSHYLNKWTEIYSLSGGPAQAGTQSFFWRSGMKTELLIGCGNSRERKLRITGSPEGWDNLVTMDFDEDCKPDILHDLEKLPYPFGDNLFDEIHAYEILEHTGQQGDWKFFFDQFAELYRILKPDGLIFASVPAWNSLWAWSDPSHKRIISSGSLIFLDQDEYKKQIGKTAMSDYRRYWKGDFKPVHMEYKGENFFFILQAKK